MVRISGLFAALALIAGCAAQPASVPTEVPTAAVPTTPETPPALVLTLEPTALATTIPPTAAPIAVQTVASVVATDVPVSAPTDQPAAASTDQPVAASTDQPVAASTDTADAAPTDTRSPCDVTARPDPLPAPGSPRARDFFQSFRQPLPPAPLYDPPGQKRVGLQAGHWQTDQVPAELGRLQAGAVGGGKQEWEVNLDVAQRAATLLEASGLLVDVLPSTVPPRYQANVFVALHADGDPAGAASGFKVARPGFSSIPDIDDRLVAAFNQTYASETELPRDDEHISLRMRYYYAFNSRRYCHAVAPGVPQAIVEMAYLTSASDRQYLIGDPDRLAKAVADSIQSFLSTEP